MSRRPSVIATAAQARAQARRVEERKNPTRARAVSFDAIANIIERECDKAGREWYRAGMIEGVPTFTATAKEIDELRPDSRKEARQLVLARLDRFPVKS